MSKIEWTDRTFNPVVGCSKVSPGCTNCYAERIASSGRMKRLPSYDGLTRDGHWTGKVTLVPEKLSDPLKWRKPQRVFVCSMSDLFHEDVPFEFIAAIFGIMAACPQHTFQILTKRPERMLEWCKWFASSAITGPATWPLRNVWLGVSVEDQIRADERIPLLIECPAVIRFLSVEPLLGPVDLNAIPGPPAATWVDGVGSALIDQVIVGGESGPGARPMAPNWARAIRDQCIQVGIAFFFKQWGGANKAKAGRELDGRTWDEMPREL